MPAAILPKLLYGSSSERAALPAPATAARTTTQRIAYRIVVCGAAYCIGRRERLTSARKRITMS